jgi:hypothetical protein
MSDECSKHHAKRLLMPRLMPSSGCSFEHGCQRGESTLAARLSHPFKPGIAGICNENVVIAEAIPIFPIQDAAWIALVRIVKQRAAENSARFKQVPSLSSGYIPP